MDLILYEQRDIRVYMEEYSGRRRCRSNFRLLASPGRRHLRNRRITEGEFSFYITNLLWAKINCSLPLKNYLAINIIKNNKLYIIFFNISSLLNYFKINKLYSFNIYKKIAENLRWINRKINLYLCNDESNSQILDKMLNFIFYLKLRFNYY